MTIILLPVATVPFDGLRRDVMPHVPMAIEPEVDYRMKQAVRDFCRTTRLWRQEGTDILVTVAGQAVYTASLDAAVEVVSVVAAWAAGSEIDVELPGERFDYEPDATHSCWRIGIDPTQDAFRLSPAPDTSGIEVIGTIALSTTESSTELPAFILNRWRSVVADGCIAKIKEQTGKPWSDATGAGYFKARFEDGCRLASNMAGPVRRRPLRVIPV